MSETWTAVDEYFDQLLGLDDDALRAALRASQDADMPQIQVAPNQGKLLHLLARAIGARRILEIGTLAGYSTIWLARALPKDGRLLTLELDPGHAQVARTNIERAGLATLVEVHVGPALDTLQRFAADGAEAFDFVFIDADKANTAEYFSRAVDLTRSGGIIVVDNVVREGTIIDAGSSDPAVTGMRRFNEVLARETRVSATVIQTVGVKKYDGFALALVAHDG